MYATHLTIRIHPIRSKPEPKVSWLVSEPRIKIIYLFPLWRIRGMPQFIITYSFIYMPYKSLSIHRITKQSLQPWDKRKVLHDLGRASFSSHNIASITFLWFVTSFSTTRALVTIGKFISIQNIIVGTHMNLLVIHTHGA